MSVATLEVPPGSVPKSTIVYLTAGGRANAVVVRTATNTPAYLTALKGVSFEALPNSSERVNEQGQSTPLNEHV